MHYTKQNLVLFLSFAVRLKALRASPIGHLFHKLISLNSVKQHLVLFLSFHFSKNIILLTIDDVFHIPILLDFMLKYLVSFLLYVAITYIGFPEPCVHYYIICEQFMAVESLKT
mmetsp:Transcript_14703/g.17177  ORF Transcript_14703/g.17177 Transcript_14703/m.17177 type:complete len:114 (-) Transcript_14703:2391-2732(-)